MQDQDLIAAFIASRGVTRVPTGRRAFTERQMKDITGPEKAVQYKFRAHMQGEDGMEFAEIITAPNERAAREQAEWYWPESQLQDIVQV